MKNIVSLVIIIMSMSLVGCSLEKEDKENMENVKEEIVKTTPTENEVDYSENFKGIKGGAVFFYYDEDTYNIYNRDIAYEEIAPYSTFKIVNSLMGLDQNIVSSPDTKLGYDGTIYSRDVWNKDIEFKEAFRESCVWYYEKIMDSLDKDYVQSTLDNLKYGNCDISAWNEDGHNSFWLSSSLKISPIEQIKVLETIFEGKSSFEAKDVDLVKDFMLVESNDKYSVYGKTGSARNTNSWFTGFLERDNKRTYFAVRIADESQELAGAVAKEIALDIINEYYNN